MAVIAAGVIALLVAVVHWLLVAAAVTVPAGVVWCRRRAEHMRWEQARAHALRYGLAQLGALSRQQFEFVVRDLMRRTAARTPSRSAGRGDLGADVSDPLGRRW
ncbi:hypothetical protein ACWEN3_04165 [Streptomyces sp. NPDC004561]